MTAADRDANLAPTPEHGDGDDGDDGDGAEAQQIVTFRSGHCAEIVRGEPRESLTLRARDGQCVLAIELTERGTTLRLSGDALEIASTSTLSLRAGHLELEADSAAIRIAGNLNERVGGDAQRQVAGRSALWASEVDIEAERGGVTVKANDDVDVQGERVRLNCDDPPAPLSWEQFEARGAKALAADAAEDAETALEPTREAPDEG